MFDTISNILTSILTNILTALYQPFGFSFLLAFLFMFFYLSAREKGWKESVRKWTAAFRKDVGFRRMFALAFYTSLVLFRTLLNRELWLNPLSDVTGGWLLYRNGVLTTESIENVILMVPFAFLWLWTFGVRIPGGRLETKDESSGQLLWHSVKITFIFSISIEFSQLLFRLGTFQFSDIVYNTIGGFTGGIIYLIWRKIRG